MEAPAVSGLLWTAYGELRIRTRKNKNDKMTVKARRNKIVHS